ncbi:molybdopterin molybdotransferase MoeA, partial [Pyxidicoccus sp. 3LFB2]
MNDAATLLPVEEARAQILALALPLPAEWVPLEEALGRTLAHDVTAQRTLPPWDNSAMDGYAVRSADLVGPAPVRLVVGETVYAGAMPKREVQPGTCARIMTGAPLPPGADAVVMRERTRPVPDGGADQVDILEAVGPGHFVRPRGEDAREGQVLLPPGARRWASLNWGCSGPRASCPRRCRARPGVAILSTGDELCRADELPQG